jgi:hypothetical protein
MSETRKRKKPLEKRLNEQVVDIEQWNNKNQRFGRIGEIFPIENKHKLGGRIKENDIKKYKSFNGKTVLQDSISKEQDSLLQGLENEKKKL